LLVPVGHDRFHAFPLCNALGSAFTKSTVKAYSLNSFGGPFKRKFMGDEKCVISLDKFGEKSFETLDLVPQDDLCILLCWLWKPSSAIGWTHNCGPLDPVTRLIDCQINQRS